MELIHHKWTKNGREFLVKDSDKKVYKSNIGQYNVDCGNGEYAPYLWDANSKTITFRDSKIKFTTTGLEFYKDDKLLTSGSFYPEVKRGILWNRPTPAVSNFQVREITGEDATDRIEISYAVSTEDQKGTVRVRVGGHGRALFSFDVESKATKTTTQRLCFEFDTLEKGELLYPHFAKKQATKARSLMFDSFFFSWNKGEEDDHKYEEVGGGKHELGLLEKQYAAKEIGKLSPTTWGPTATADDCFVWGGTFYDQYGNTLYTGYYWSAIAEAGWEWEGVTASGTAENGCKISVNVNFKSTHSGQLLKAVDKDTISWASGGDRPDTIATLANSVSWTIDATGWVDSPEIKTLCQDIINAGHTDWGFVLLDDSTSGYVKIWAQETADAATLTVVYTTGGGGVTVTPGVINLASVAQGETIKAGAEITPQALNLASSCPEETIKAGATITPDVLNLISSIEAETIKCGVTITPGIQSVLAQIQEGTIKVGVTISPGVINLVAATQDEIVALPGGVTISPNAIVLIPQTQNLVILTQSEIKLLRNILANILTDILKN